MQVHAYCQLPNHFHLVSEELKKRKLAESDLPTLPKGERRKVEIAQRLRAETIVMVKWIAERLQMESVAYVNNRLYLNGGGS